MTIVRDVLPLDAFTRCWTEEDVLLDRVVALLVDPQRGAMQALSAAWRQRNLGVFHSSVGSMAAYLAGAAVDKEVAGPASADDADKRGTLDTLKDALKFAAVDKKRAMKALRKRLKLSRLDDESTLGGRGLSR